jgi:hypothetical protein
MPGAHSIERFLIEEHLHQIIEMYHIERKEWYVYNYALGKNKTIFFDNDLKC